MTSGAIYIITQDPRYVGLLENSAASLKRAMPGLPITAFSQFPIESPCIDSVVRVSPSRDGCYDKARLMLESPYERTLFIDADTYVLEPVDELFALLDHFDCAATHEEYLNTDWDNRYPRRDIPASFPEYNTGILAFNRSDRVRSVLGQWSVLYEDFLRTHPNEAINDQPFFRAAVYFGSVRIATLSREYNCKFRGQGYLNGRVKILHGHVNFQLPQAQVERVTRVMNASKLPRVYIAGKVFEQKVAGRLFGNRKARLVGQFSDPRRLVLQVKARRLRQAVKERGIGGTVARLFGA